MEKLHQKNEIICGNYRIINQLGKGAFGVTYEAQDLRNNHCVAIKILSLNDLTDWKVLELFERESKVLERLNHPSIPNYIDYFTIDTQKSHEFYLVQELISGESLGNLINKGWRFTEEEIYDIAIQILEILDYLHRLTPPVIHRDIKPQNIIRKPDGKVYLVDFGAVQDVYRNSIIKGGTFVGTMGYIAPEQLRGRGFFASDLYSLGATLLFLITHRSPEELPRQRMKIKFEDLQENINLSHQFIQWLDKMIEPTIEGRFKSASEALTILKSKQIIAEKKQEILEKEREVNCLRTPPKGSKVKVKRTTQKLKFHIPPTGWNFANIALLIFSLIWNMLMLSVFTSVIITEGTPLFILFFILPFILFGLSFLCLFLFNIAGHNYLFFDEKEMLIGWYCLGIARNQKVSRAEIDSLKIFTQYDSSTGKKEVIKIQTKYLNYQFGNSLTIVEKEWLAEEIADFLSISLQENELYIN